jgi:hypothetical protein
MFDQYVKMFDLVPWIDAWLIEAVTVIFGALLIGYVVAKAVTKINGDEQ